MLLIAYLTKRGDQASLPNKQPDDLTAYGGTEAWIGLHQTVCTACVITIRRPTHWTASRPAPRATHAGSRQPSGRHRAGA